MAVKATFVADFTAFNQGVEKADVKLRTFETGIGRIDKDLSKFGNQFSGTRVISEATLMEKAIREIGGTSKLTSDELARAGNTAKQAADKMQALGLGVPERLQDLAKHAKSSTTELSAMDQIVGKLGPMLAATFSVGAIVGFAKEFGSFAGQMKDLSAQTGIGVERLQALNYVGAAAGVTVEDITGSVGQLSKRLAGDDASASAAMDQLGLSTYQFLQQSPDQAFIDIGQAISRIQNPMERTRVAMELFGKSGASMLRIMGGDLDQLVEEAERTGAVIQKELIDKADAFDDAWHQALMRAKASFINFFGSVITGWNAVQAAQKNAQPSGVMDTLLGGPQGAATGAGGRIKDLVDAWWYRDQAAADVALQTQSLSRGSGKGSVGLPKGFLPGQLAVPSVPNDLAGLEKKLAGLVHVETDGEKAARKWNEELEKFAGWQYHIQQIAVKAGMTGAPSAGGNAGGLMQEILGNTSNPLAFLTGPNTSQLKSQSASRTSGASGFSAMLQKQLGPTILSALTGGGSVVKSVGGLLGGGLTEKLFGGDSGLTKSISGGLSKVLGKSLGGALSSVLPGIGALAGPAIEGLSKLFGKIFGGEGKKVNDMRDQFIGAAGGIDVLAQQAQKAGTSVDRLLGAKKVKDFEAAVSDLQAKLGAFSDDQAADAARLTAAIERYGFSFEQLGAAFQKQRLDEQAKDLIEDWRVLVGSGIDLTLVNEKMSGAINEYLQTALKVGQEIPNAFRPILQKMLEQGTLTDEAGNAITDLEGAGIHFSETMTQGFDRVVQKLDELITKLIAAGTAINALPSLPSASGPVNDFGFGEGSPDLPGFASGTGGRFLNFGGGTPVMLHGRERVMTEAEGDGANMAAVVAAVDRVAAQLAFLQNILPDQMRASAAIGRARFA